MGRQRSALLTLQFPSQLRPPAPKISQAGDLGVVEDSIHVNLKHTRSCVQCVFSIAGPHALGLWTWWASWQLLKHSHPERRITITISDQFLGEIGHSLNWIMITSVLKASKIEDKRLNSNFELFRPVQDIRGLQDLLCRASSLFINRIKRSTCSHKSHSVTKQ